MSILRGGIAHGDVNAILSQYFGMSLTIFAHSLITSDTWQFLLGTPSDS